MQCVNAQEPGGIQEKSIICRCLLLDQVKIAFDFSCFMQILYSVNALASDSLFCDSTSRR